MRYAACHWQSTGNPLVFGTGNKWLIEVDVQDGGEGLGSLRFARTYNSNAGTVSGLIGARWRTDFGQRLGFDGSANNGTIWTYRPDGKALKHVLASGTYTPDADIADRLYEDTSNGGAYRLHRADGGVERYDAAGKLLAVTDIKGRTSTLYYSDGSDGASSGLGGYVLDAMGAPAGNGVARRSTDPGC
jgi:hypothetical protein